jgi:hypothetical protein
MSETEKNDYTRQTLAEEMPDDLPAVVNQRMQNQLVAFRERLDTKSPVSRFPSIRSLFRSRLVGWTRMAVGTAVILIAAFFISQGWHPAESIAWADVTEAMAKKPWLHQVETSQNGTSKEYWYSASRAIEGSHYVPSGPGHRTERYTWTDFANETQLYYSPDAQQIFRGTRSKEYWQSRKFFSAAWGSAFLSGDLGGSIQAGGYEVVDQQQREVTRGGKRCIEFRFRWSQQDEDAESVTQFVVLVDPKTRLPFRMDLVVHPGQEPRPFSQIGYPADGPSDLYEMGVPKTAEVVDCSLSADVERLAKATVAAGCRDDVEFSALVVRSLLGRHSGYRVWKKGLRWRIDTTIDPLSRPPEKLSLSEADSQRWWRQQAENARFVPSALFDGKQHWEYSTSTRRPNQAEIDAGADKDSRVILSTEKTKLLPWPRDYYWEESPLRSMGHPTTLLASPPTGLPIYDAPCLATINQEPNDGPPNTILLELRDPAWKLDDSGEWRSSSPQIIRFWIDPERDHLVMRCDELISQGPKEKLIGGFAIEGLTQDPPKRWFPTVVRQRVQIKPPDNEKDIDDVILRFYYDFDTPISDSLWSKID